MGVGGPPPAALPLLELAKQPWLEHASDIAGALLYLDAGAAEFAHTSLGAPLLLGAS